MKDKLGQDQAFPTLSNEYDGKGNVLHYQYEGMNKRFYAACAAMQGILANELVMEIAYDLHNTNVVQSISTHIVTMAYEYADELLKQENE